MSSNTQNFGSQTLLWDYRQEARAKGFNQAFCDTLPYGLYTGGRLSRVSNTVVNIGFLVCIIKSDENDNVALRIETAESQDVSLAVNQGSTFADITKPYIVLRFGWQDVEVNYMNMLAVGWSANPAETSPDRLRPFDIILGKVLFEEASPGSGQFIIANSNPFDVTRRQDVFIKDTEIIAGQFRVSSSETDSRKVFVSGGRVNTSQGQFVVPGSEFPSEGIPDTASMGRTDLIALDAYGKFKFIQGTPAVNPAAPKYQTYKVLAEIRRGPHRSSILGTDIVPITDATIRGQILAGDFSIEDSENLFPDSDKNLEGAINYLMRRSITLEDALAALTQVVNSMGDTMSGHIASTVDQGNTVHGMQVESNLEYPLDIDV